MSPHDSFDELMQRLRAGDQPAAAAVFQRFAQRLVALASRRLEEAARQKEDPEDVVQSVFRSFFTRQQQGQLDVANWDNLWAILTLMTIRKCANRSAYFHAACRDVHREERSLSHDDSVQGWQALADDPTPSEAAVLTETVEQLMRQFEARDREIVTLHLQGYTIPEISSQVQRSERTVCRIMDRVRKRLRRLREEEGVR
jgi:RNA polymerase sigma-70 factor (ECF subfamily)